MQPDSMLLVVYSSKLLCKAVLLFLESASFLPLISGMGTISEMACELIIEILKLISAIFYCADPMTQSDPKFAQQLSCCGMSKIGICTRSLYC